MDVLEQLALPKGVTAIIGSGGKTTLMLLLAQRLPGRVIIGTTTKIYPPTQVPVFTEVSAPEQIAAALQEHGKICVGTKLENGKLSAPQIAVETLTQLADYVILEADGSKHLPLKAHLAFEPVIPACAKRRLLVVGMSGIGAPICQAAHRPERFAALAGKCQQAIATPADVAKVIEREALCDTVLCNQAETTLARSAAEEIASYLPVQTFACALQAGDLTKL